MVTCCVCRGCPNNSLSGHRMHFFPNRTKRLSTFRSWVRFVRLQRTDFKASSVTRFSSICGAHFRPEDYSSSDRMKTEMGFKSPFRMRLNEGAVPSILPKPKSPRAAPKKRKKTATSRKQHKPLSSTGNLTNDGKVYMLSYPLDVVLQCAIRPYCPSSGKNSDDIPSVFKPSPEKRKDQHTDNLSTNQAAKKRKVEAVVPHSPENCSPLCDDDGCKEQIHSIKSQIEALRAENQLMRLNLSINELNESALRNSDAHVLTLTGLPTFSILMELFRATSPHLRLTSPLTSFQHFLLTLMKLRLDLSFDFLAFHFGVGAFTVSKLFRHCVSVMFSRLVPALVVWPERGILRKTLPNAFCSKTLQNTVCIMDCFEISVENPCVLLSNEHDYSMVKSYDSFKYLIAMSPQGSISFISKGWGGHTVDRLITKDSHFLSHLAPGDLVLADRDFNVAQSREPSHNNVTIKAFTRGRTRLVPVKLESQSLASLRTHVERAAGVVRQKFTLLRSTVPVSFTDTDEESNVMYLDQIVKVCCALTNVCASAVPPQ